MIDPLVHALAIFLAIILTAGLNARRKPIAIAALGAIFLGIYSSTSAVFLLFTLIQALAICIWVDKKARSDKWRKYGPYLLLVNLFFVDFHKILTGFPVETVGVSFAIIRLFMTAKQLVSSRSDMRAEYLEWLFVGTFYLPAIIIGPIFSGLDIRKQAVSPENLTPRTSRTYRGLSTGLVLAVLASPLFSSIAEGSGPIVIIASFLALFSAFWGQSLLAENGSLLLGFKIPRNFNKPWMARDIRDFWQRWHISMARFIIQYIYMPLTLNGIPPKAATVCAFVFMGLWHEVAPGYFIWGLAHGLLMAYWPRHLEFSPPRWQRWLERTFTLSAVIFISYVANSLFEVAG